MENVSENNKSYLHFYIKITHLLNFEWTFIYLVKSFDLARPITVSLSISLYFVELAWPITQDLGLTDRLGKLNNVILCISKNSQCISFWTQRTTDISWIAERFPTENSPLKVLICWESKEQKLHFCKLRKCG